MRDQLLYPGRTHVRRLRDLVRGLARTSQALDLLLETNLSPPILSPLSSSSYPTYCRREADQDSGDPQPGEQHGHLARSSPPGSDLREYVVEHTSETKRATRSPWAGGRFFEEGREVGGGGSPVRGHRWQGRERQAEVFRLVAGHGVPYVFPGHKVSGVCEDLRRILEAVRVGQTVFDRHPRALQLYLRLPHDPFGGLAGYLLCSSLPSIAMEPTTSAESRRRRCSTFRRGELRSDEPESYLAHPGAAVTLMVSPIMFSPASLGSNANGNPARSQYSPMTGMPSWQKAGILSRISRSSSASSSSIA